MSDNTFSRSPLVRFLKGIWLAVDFSRKLFMNLIFLAIVFIVLIALMMPGKPGLQEKSALVIHFDGPIYEQRPGAARSKLIEQMLDDAPKELQLRDVLATLDAAAKDPKIDRVVMIFENFGGTGLATLREVAAALDKFKASGKQVVAWSSAYDQPAYYLAAHANEVYLHPMGQVFLRGYGGHRNYYKEALEKVGVAPNVLRVGKYKNFGEPFFASGPSAETLESDKYLYDGLWKTYTDGVEKARKLPEGSVNRGIESVVKAMTDAGGDAAKVALDAKLVTGLKTRDQLRALMIERGAEDKTIQSFRQIAFQDYQGSVTPKLFGDGVGVIVAQGEIVEGRAPPGTVGGLSTADLVRKAREDTNIKAVVLRVDSPGGSAYGSELVRRELELTRAAGKPVVVSMGDLAASGGYWISMAADEVIADPATITGSIGVFGMLPTGEKTMEKLSIKTGGYSTTWLADAMYDPRRPLDPRFAELVQSAIGKIYTDFLAGAAKARKSTPEKIDEVAQGRVWTGAQAKDRGLIDKVGSFQDALKSARERAKLGDDARVAYIEADRGKFAAFLDQLGGGAARLVAKHVDLKPWLPAGAPANAVKEVREELGWLSEIAQRSATGLPFGVVAHCLCGK
ncbi:MAG: signal peptide peptidase SppA [Betaproteobacteria bacterium]|nr:signal peptide peptidase SppA [Betaproteobacteria bacterium]